MLDLIHNLTFGIDPILVIIIYIQLQVLKEYFLLGLGI